jgi:hypothetical protein
MPNLTLLPAPNLLKNKGFPSRINIYLDFIDSEVNFAFSFYNM